MGARTLDVDVLAVEGMVLTTESLTLPHPLAAQRAFVLIPWAEVDPGFVLSPGLSVARRGAGCRCSGRPSQRACLVGAALVHPTSIRLLLAIGASGMLLGFLGARFWDSWTGAPPSVPWAAPTLLAFVAAAS